MAVEGVSVIVLRAKDSAAKHRYLIITPGSLKKIIGIVLVISDRSFIIFRVGDLVFLQTIFNVMSYCTEADDLDRDQIVIRIIIILLNNSAIIRSRVYPLIPTIPDINNGIQVLISVAVYGIKIGYFAGIRLLLEHLIAIILILSR